MGSDVTQDFIFGTLATDELRLAALRTAGRRVSHDGRITPPDPEPGQPVALNVEVGTDVDAETVVASYTVDGGDPGADAARVVCERGEVVWDTLLWGYRQEWRGHLPPQPAGTTVRYQIAATAADGTTAWADPDSWTGAPTTFGYHVDRERVPDWVRDAVVYHLFVDRFAPGGGRAWNPAPTLNDFWGGTLRGVIEHLPHVEALGATCIWLSPVFASPSHHGYDATDYFRVEPRLGTDADLTDLFAAAHARGIRVLLDLVANHVSNEHPAFRRATTEVASPERGWFTFRRWPEEYRAFFDVPTLPQLDHEQAAPRRYVIDAATHWLRQGADGFRLDYADGPPLAFWSEFRAATRAVKADSFTVGEVVEAAARQRSYQGRLDGTLDFLLLAAMRAFFALDALTPSAFDAFLRRHQAYFPPDFVLPSFLDNHDMNRFLWVVGGDTRRLKLAALCQFTLPHPPVVYYGTEIGLSQRRDLQYPDGSRRLEESRTPMLWGADQDRDLFAFYQQLVAARRQRPALWRGKRSVLALTDDGLYAVALRQGHDAAVVALNRTTTDQRLPLPAGLGLVLGTDDQVRRSGGQLDLPPMSGALLIGPEPSAAPKTDEAGVGRLGGARR